MVNSFYLRLMIGVALLGLAVRGVAAQPVIVDEHFSELSVSSYGEYVVASPELTLGAVRALPADRWQRVEDDDAGFGLEPGAIWLRFDMVASSRSARDLVLEVAYPVLDSVSVFLLENGRLIRQMRSGDHLPFHERPIAFRNFALPFSLNSTEPVTAYIRIETEGIAMLPVTLWSGEAFADYRQHSGLVHGVFYGGLLALLLYNAFLYLAIRHPSYLYYTVTLLGVGLSTASVKGLGFQYLWPDLPQLNQVAIFISSYLFGIFGILFTVTLLKMRVRLPRIYRVCQWYIALDVAMIIFVFVLPYDVSLLGTLLIGITGAVIIFASGFYLWLKRYSGTGLFMAACGAILVAEILLISSRLGVIPSSPAIENSMEIGTFISMVLFSFALAARVNHERREKLIAQQTLATELDSLVQQRTVELENANEQLKILTERDGLTGLYNRRHFDRMFEQEYAGHRRERASLCVVMVDLDHFKSLNDNHGHQFGDECLRVAAGVLSDYATRPRDVSARYGGEEFILLLPHTDTVGGTVVAEEVRVRLEETRITTSEGVEVELTASFGLAAAVPQPGQDHEGLLRAADDALYQAKAAGRNRVVAAAGIH